MPTDEEWRDYLEWKLAEQQSEIEVFEDYYQGNHALGFATSKFQQAFGDLFESFADNWCRTIVEASVERLVIDGFRVDDDEAADKEAWRIWQRNRLDAGSTLAHTEAIKDGRAFLMVSPGGRITVEHASQVVVEHAPGDRQTRLAALKKWRDRFGYTYATLFLPDRVVKWRSGVATPITGALVALSIPEGIGGWDSRPDDPGGENPYPGIVPVIPLLNNPTVLGEGTSDLAPAIALQDAINKEVMDMLVASEFAAFRQRILTGIEVPTVINEDGDQVPDPEFALKASVARMITTEDPNVGVHEFAASDLSNYTGAKDSILHDLAAITRTPPHYLLGQITNASGDALKAAETGLVAKVKRKQTDFSDSWEEAIGLALGRQDASASIETIWRDPEYRTEGEQVDAAVKLRSIGVPLEACWERVGATPQQIERWKSLTGLPDRPPAGATMAQMPPVIGGSAS